MTENIIPKHLIDQIKSGNVVLFMGAGSSYGSKNTKNETIPNGNQLSILLGNKFLGEQHSGDLAYISELCISESSLFDVQQYIREIFNEFQPCDYHKKISDFSWKALFSTNYDLIIEQSYQKNKNKLQELVPVFKDTNANLIFYKDNILPYYKIHGSIDDINDKDAPLILTHDQFAKHKKKRERMFGVLQELMYDHTFIFIGFGMADADIRNILNELDSDNTNRARSYIINPNITSTEIRLWESKKISPLKITFENFLVELESKIDKNTRNLSKLYNNQETPIFKNFHKSIEELKPTETFFDFLNNNIEYVYSNLSSPNTDPKEFYKGYFNNWDPIIKNLDVKRRITDGIIFETMFDDEQENSKNQLLYIIKGNAGSGKSVLLKRLAFEGATTAEKFCIFHKEKTRLLTDQLIELYNYTKKRIYLFIDNISLVEDEVVYLLKRTKRDSIPLTIFGSERSNVWNTECLELSNYLTNSYDVKYLNDKEINELLALLERHNSLYTLKNKSIEERLFAFSEKAGRELLVALYEATNGKPFEEIIYDEYKSINDIRAQSLYLTVSIFHKIGAEARAGFISRVHNLPFSEFKDKLFKPLEYIVFDKENKRINDFVYLTRNRMIAEIIFTKVLSSPQDKFDEFIRILNNLNLDYESDRQAFFSIVNAKNLINIFPDPQHSRKIYDLATEISYKDSKLLQQQAMFEMASNNGSISLAERFLKDAHIISPSDPKIKHTYAELILKKAERARNNNEFHALVDDVVDKCNSLIKLNDTNLHPYHTILKCYLLKLKKILSVNDTPSIERCLKDIEKMFSKASQYSMNNEFLLEIESSFNELINDIPTAKELLEKAFNSNKASPYIAIRLSNFYEKENQLDLALNTIKEALSSSNGDKDLNFKYANLLEKNNSPIEDIKYHLKRSFSSGDSRFQAQFKYARALYITNDLTESKEIFKFLSNARLPPDVKNNPVDPIKNNECLVEYTGTIQKLEISFGFLKRDGTADEVFFSKNETEKSIYSNLRRGDKVKFNIAFNYKGANALNLQKL